MRIDLDGVGIYAHTGGRTFDPRGRVAVLLHGAAMDHTAYALQGRYLAHHGFSLLVPDLPGCGLSGGEVPDSIPDLAAWLWRLLDRLGVEKVSLAGHSMGALTALSAAAARPERVSRLCLLGAGYPMAVNAEFLEAARRNDRIAVLAMNDWAHAMRAKLGGAALPGLWMVGAAIRLVERARPGTLYRCLSICNDYDRGLEDAARITCPTGMILGQQDMMAPPRAITALAQALGGEVRSEILPETGHMMMSERPRKVAELLEKML